MKNKLRFTLKTVIFIVFSFSSGFYFFNGDDHSKPIPDANSHGEQYNGISNNITAGTWSAGATIVVKSLAGGASTYMRNDTGWLFYIGGDIDFNGSMTARTEVYNTANNSWTTMAPCPSTIEYTGCATLKDSIYIIGGLVTSVFSAETNVVRKYSIRTNTWTTVTSLPQVVAGNKAWGYQDSLIYSVGGMGSGSSNAINNVYLYNCRSNTWRSATPLPLALTSGAMTIYGDTIFYVGGGSTYFGPYVQSGYKGFINQSDRSQINWIGLPAYTGPSRWRFDAAPWGNKGIIIAGGSLNTTFSSSNECYLLLNGSSWTAQPNMTQAVGSAGIGSFLFSNGIGKFIVASGEDYPGNPYTVNNCQIYTDTAIAQPPLGPICEGFNSPVFPPYGWLYVQQNGNWISRVSQSGFNLGTGSIKIDYWTAPVGLAGYVNSCIFVPSQPLDSLYFDLAYCPLGVTDSLIILASTNAGTSWLSIFREGGNELQTTVGCNRPFVPQSASDWQRRGLPVPTGTNRLRIQSYSGFGDNLYLDSICIVHPLGITRNGNEIPKIYSLSQNYPNPFNPTTLIDYALPKAGNVEIKVYDVLGKEAAVLVNEFKQPGNYKVLFNANNFASGVYFYKIKSGDFESTKKMLLIK